jgi:type IV pilus assembly protein PilW
MNNSPITFFRHPLPGRSQGLTLIELMISLALGMLVILSVGYAYIGSRTTFRQQDALGRMQENARFVFETLSNDIRMVGYAGSLCGLLDTDVVNALPNPTNWDQDIFSTLPQNGIPLKGYEDAATTAPDVSGTVYAGTSSDALSVLHADSTKEYVVNAAAANGAAISFSGTAPADGNVVVTDCGNAKPRQAFALAGSVNGLPTPIAAQSRIMPLIANLYFVRANGDGTPSIYRKSGASAPQELVEGVEDMQITYGVDTSNPATCSDNDGGVDAYVTADKVEDDATVVPCATPAERWKKVLAVRVTLSMRSVEDGITTDVQPAGDRRLRKTFTTTIAARNRL